MDRRDFLKLSVALPFSGSMIASLASCESPSDGPRVDRSKPMALRVPPVLSGNSIAASYGRTELWQGSSTGVLLLNGSYLGPTIVRQRGDMIDLNFVNQLGESSIIHWHGLNVPPEMDGHPAEAIANGTYHYSFPIQQRAGTYWYHAHPDMFTAKQAYLGFAGVVVVQDPQEQALPLPRWEYDVPVVIQDKRTTATDTEVHYAPSHDDTISGYLGNEIFVNGTPNAYLDVKKAIYRLRFLNGSNARVYRLAFSDDREFHVIGTDGGLLDRPYPVREVTLSPGERVEVLLDLRQDSVSSKLDLISKEFIAGGSHSGVGYKQGERMQVLVLRVTANSDQALDIPGSLVTLERLNEASAVRERIFQLTMDHSRESGMHRIDGKVFEMDRSDYQVPFGELEIWEIQNQAQGLHSMHVHGTMFQVLERRFAEPMTPVDYGWKDTVLVNDNETVRLLVRFNDYRGRYLFHCHFLEHEDDGMMVNIDVI